MTAETRPPNVICLIIAVYLVTQLRTDIWSEKYFPPQSLIRFIEIKWNVVENHIIHCFIQVSLDLSNYLLS